MLMCLTIGVVSFARLAIVVSAGYLHKMITFFHFAIDRQVLQINNL